MTGALQADFAAVSARQRTARAGVPAPDSARGRVRAWSAERRAGETVAAIGEGKLAAVEHRFGRRQQTDRQPRRPVSLRFFSSFP
jgi:hypothetical protein